MSVYVAGPMTGIAEHNYPAFAAVAAELRGMDVEVVSPHELHDGDRSRSHEYYMRRNLRAMLECDELVLLPGWINSAGARLEVEVAAACGLRINELLAIGGQVTPLTWRKTAPRKTAEKR